MENKVYYGEYSLKHWINLLLKKDIELPEYQRYFVWDKNRVKQLLKSFLNKQFVPPVTIGAYNDKGNNRNLILDGQQRLSSILLAYLGLYPNRDEYKKLMVSMADENDDIMDSSESNEQYDDILSWTMRLLIEKGNTRELIKKAIVKGNYEEIDYQVDDTFFDNNYLGFAYLVPHNNNARQQQQYFSTIFRNINTQGQALLPQESRESLYYLDENLATYFKPDFCNKMSINGARIDFVRILALLSQYKKESSVSTIAKGYAKKMEAYYEEYIYSVIGENTTELFVDFPKVFKEGKFEKEFETLKTALTNFDLFKKYDSIIEFDATLFGLVYSVLFKKKNIDIEKKDGFFKDVEINVGKYKKDYLHTKNPAALKYLRVRLDESIDMIKRYEI